MFPSSNRSLSCDNIAQQARDAESQQKTGKEIPHAHAQAGEGSHNGAPEETSRVHLDHPPPAKPPSVWKNRKNRSVSWDDLPAQINSICDGASSIEEEDAGSSQSGSRCSSRCSIDEGEQFAVPRQNWQPDEEAKFCQAPGCERRFSPIHRRHHCRKCGRVVCSSCSHNRMDLYNEAKGYRRENQRVCNACRRLSTLSEESKASGSDSPSGFSPSSKGSLREVAALSSYHMLSRERFLSGGSSGGSEHGRLLSGSGGSSEGHPDFDSSDSENWLTGGHVIGAEDHHEEFFDGSLQSTNAQDDNMMVLKKSSSMSSVKNMLWSRRQEREVADDETRSTSSQQSSSQGKPLSSTGDSKLWALLQSPRADKIEKSEKGGRWYSSGLRRSSSGFLMSRGSSSESNEQHAEGRVEVGYNGGLFIRTSQSKKLEQSGSGGTIKLPAPNTIFYWSGKHMMDKCGLFYWLGSCGGTRDWINPASESSAVRVTGSSWTKGKLQDVLCVDPDKRVDSWSASEEGAWFQVELPEGIQLQPTHYCLRHGYSSGAHLRNWKFLVSADGESWTQASTHAMDESLKGPYAVRTWQIPVHVEAARFFKVVTTGGNSINGTQLVCGGFELYGQVIRQQNEGILNPSHWFFKGMEGMTTSA